MIGASIRASLMLIAIIALCPTRALSGTEDHSAHQMSPSKDAEAVEHAMHAVRPEVITRCTQGSYIGAINSAHAATKALELLKRSTDKQARQASSEVASMLAIALERSDAESSCLQGLAFGYDEFYARVLTQSLAVAKAHGLPPKAIAHAQAALKAIEALPRAVDWD
jgi:hypothetical protein